MAWYNHIHKAIRELNPIADPFHDYRWVSTEDGPVMEYWNEVTMGPLDLAALQSRCEEIEVIGEVPKSVTRAQALLALYNAGKLDALEAIIAAHPYRPVRIWFDNANVWERANPYVNLLGPELGLTDEDIDRLFIEASRL